eukprot:CAMPEP_0204514476 /NCGR_PEP_ID=MMETSP0661-20131031/2085_1 /ASSEMBLY_ACC=CAM_ASM_000606 /TAXON_ID=109239 /ORGANISM="Alexandrium margalefi, Strain AMGDE01CS-322" /LENGTH=507 /DNA_ID=CAMNT_0051519723 /DNA_START=44 /DNA_END=1563 /DNA_ORIENTATION=+
MTSSRHPRAREGSEAQRRPASLALWAVRELRVVGHLRLDLEHDLLPQHLPDGAGDVAPVEVEEEDHAERHAEARPGEDAEAQALADVLPERTREKLLALLRLGGVTRAHGLEHGLGVEWTTVAPPVDPQGLWAPGGVLDLVVQKLLAVALDAGVDLVDGDADLLHHLVRALGGEAVGGAAILDGTSLGEGLDVVPELLGVRRAPGAVGRRPGSDVPEAELPEVLPRHVGARDWPRAVGVGRAVLRALVRAELAIGGAGGGREAEDVVVRHKLQVVLQDLGAVLEALQELARLPRPRAHPEVRHHNLAPGDVPGQLDDHRAAQNRIDELLPLESADQHGGYLHGVAVAVIPHHHVLDLLRREGRLGAVHHDQRPGALALRHPRLLHERAATAPDEHHVDELLLAVVLLRLLLLLRGRDGVVPLGAVVLPARLAVEEPPQDALPVVRRAERGRGAVDDAVGVRELPHQGLGREDPQLRLDREGQRTGLQDRAPGRRHLALRMPAAPTAR